MSICHRCGKQIIWAADSVDARLKLDAKPVKGGNFELGERKRGKPSPICARVQPQEWLPRYVEHRCGAK